MPHQRSKQRHQTSLRKLLCLRAIKPRNRRYSSILLLHPRYEDNQRLWSKSTHKQIQPSRRDYHQNQQDLCCERSNSGWGSINWCQWWLFSNAGSCTIQQNQTIQPCPHINIPTVQERQNLGHPCNCYSTRANPTPGMHQRRSSVLCIPSKSKPVLESLWRLLSQWLWRIWRIVQHSK